MDSTRKWYNLGSGILALFIVAALLGATFSNALAERITPEQMKERFNPAMAKDITGADVQIWSAPYIAPGGSGTWWFRVTNSSPDLEWLDLIEMDFPAGITVTGASDFVNQSTPLSDLVYDGTTGDGVLVSWVDPDAGFGEIYDGDWAAVQINVTVSPTFTGDVSIDWHVSGDDFGAVPHDIIGTVVLPALELTNHDAPYYVTGDFDNVLVMDFSLRDTEANDWLDALTLMQGPSSSMIDQTSFDNVELWHDLNGNDTFDPGAGDLLVGTLIWDGIDSWEIFNLGASANSPITTAGDRYFVSVDVATACPDDAVIQFEIPALYDWAPFTVFDPSWDEGIYTLGGGTGPPSAVVNTYTQIVNRYSVMADFIINDVTDPDWVGPLNNQVLVLDFEVPDNWTLADEMTAITFENFGTATSADLLTMQLWRDDVTPGWDTGGETVVGECLPYIDDTHWYLDLATTPEAIPVAGARFYVTVNIADTAANATTIQMGIPQLVDTAPVDGAFDIAGPDEGVFFASRNDGPFDGDLVNSESIVIDSGPPDIAFDEGVGSWTTDDANAYGSYARQTTISTPVLVGGAKGHTLDTLEVDTNQYGVSWGAQAWSKTIKWTVTYDASIVTPDKWVIEGQNADGTGGGPGVQTNQAADGVQYFADGNELSFWIFEDGTPVDGEYFYFYTTRNIVGMPNPSLQDDDVLEAEGDEVQDELDLDEIIVSVDGITDPGSGIASVRIYCTFDNSDPVTAKTTVKDMFNPSGDRWWTNGATPDNILPAELTDGNLVKFIVRAVDNVGNVAESEIQMFEIDNTGPSTVAPTFTWNADNTLTPPNVVNVGDVLDLNVDMVAQEVPSFTEIVSIKTDITSLLNEANQTFYWLGQVAPYNGNWTGPVTIMDMDGNSGKDDNVELPADLAAVIQVIDHIGNMDETVIWNVADNSQFNGFDNFNPETPPPTVALDQDNTPVPPNTVNIGDVVQVAVDVNAVDDTGVLFVTVDMRAYGTAWGAAEHLNDGGYDGDDIAGDGIWSREFLVGDGGAFAVDQLNLDNTVSAILTDDAGNPDLTPEMIADGNTLDIDTDAPGATANNWDIATMIGGVNWLDYFGDPSIANPGDRAIVRWNAAADGETLDVVTVTADLSEWGGPADITLLVDEGGYEGASYNDWDGDHDEDLWLFGALWDFVVGTIDDPETDCYLTVTDDAGNVVTCTTGTDEGTPAEPLSVDIILPLGSLTVAVGYHAGPPKAMYAGINDTLFFTFDASATTPFDVIPPNGGVAVDLTDFGFPFQTTPLVLDRGAAPDTMKWYGWYQIGGSGVAGNSNMGPLGTEIAFDVDMDFEATVYDDALNEFTDNFGTIIHCDNTGVVNIQGQYTSIWVVDVNLADGIAAIGDTIYFGFDNSDATGQDVGDIRNGVSGVYVDIDRDGVFEASDLQLTDPDLDEMWEGWHVVTDSSASQPWAIEDTAKVTFGFYAMDNGMNTSMGMGFSLDSIYVDNIRPEGTLANSTVTDVTTGTVQKVSVGDILNIRYDLDRINDNVSCLVDLQAYGYSASYSLGSTLSLNLPVMDVDDPDYILDVLPGNALIEPTMTICTNPAEVTDNAGNTYVPGCVLPFDWTTWGVDNDAPVSATPTIVVLDDHDFKGNGMVNFGDRLDILCNMSAVPDMAGGTVRVNLFGYGGNSSDNVDAGLILTDDAFSEGGEGDLMFSFVLQDAGYTGGFMKGFVVGSGPDGAPGCKGCDDDMDGQFDNPDELFVAGDDRTGNIDTDPPEEATNPPSEYSAIEVKAFDDDGCPAESAAESAELTWVVDTYQPDLDDVDMDFFDSDGVGEPGHGVVNIGDTLVVYVDAITDVGLMSYDYYGAIPVTVDMSAYGYSEDEPISAVYDTTTWGAAMTWYRMFVIMEGDDGIDVGVSDSDSRVGATGWDDADNWMLSPLYSSPLPYQVDSDMPGAVMNLTASPVQGGRIKLEWDAPLSTPPKAGGYTDDVAYYHIYQGDPDSDLVSYTVPTESISPATTVWYSDTLLVEHSYLFGVRVEDDAGNIEQNMNVVSGKIPDSIVPFATITYPPNGNLLVWGPDGAPGEANVDDDGINGVDDPGEVGYGGSDDYMMDVVATMSDMDVVKVDIFWRLKDADPLLEGDQPGPWNIGGTVIRNPGDPQQETFTATIDLSMYPSDIYEIIAIPTDGADNFPSHQEAYEFSHIEGAWDRDPPSIIYLSVNGDASPNAATLIPQGIIPMIVHAEDYGQQAKGQVPDYIKVSVMPDGYMVPITAYEADGVTDWPHHFTINTTGYPNGLMEINLWLMDPSGNVGGMPPVQVTIEDITSPTAVITNPPWDGTHITGEAYPIIVEPGLDAYGNPVTDLARVDAYYSEDGSEPWNWIGFDTTPEEDKQADVFFMIPWNTNDLVHDEDYYLFCEITDVAGNKDSTKTVMVIKDDTALPLSIEIDDMVMVNGTETIKDTVRINAWHNDPNTSSVKFEWRYAWDPDEDAFYNAIGTDWSAPYWYMFNTETVGGANWDQQNYPIVIKATPKDNAGNDGVGVLYPVTVDNKAPWFSIYSVNGFISSNDVNVMGGTDAEIVVHTLDADVSICRLQAITPSGFIGIAELTAYDSYDPVTGVYTYSATWTAPVYNDNTDITIHCGGRDIIDNRSMVQMGDDFFELEVLGTDAMTVMMSVPQHGTNIMGTWTPGMIQGTTGNTDVAQADLQFQTPGETVWHTYGIDESGPTWENPAPIMTTLMTDGDWNMRWLAWDADGNFDPEPQHITVTVDNTPPVAVIDAFDMERGNKEVLLTAECSDDKGAGSYPASVQFVDFWVKLDNDAILNYTHVGTDYTAPYEFTYDTRNVPNGDGMYHFVATGTDNAGFQYGFPGNAQDPTYAAFELLDIDNSGPADLMISDIGDNHNPPTQGSTLPQAEEMTIIATSTDLDVAWFRFYFKHIDAMDYNEIDTDTEVEIIDGQSVGSAVVNTMNWMAGDVYVIKIEAADDLGNEALAYYDFKIGLPMAYILSIDDETGEIVAECNNTTKLVKFDFMPDFKGSKGWEGIETVGVDENGYAKVIWHYDEMAVGDGDFKVRAWASDDSLEWAEGLKQDEEDVGHWSLTKTGNHFDMAQSTLEGFQLATPNDNSNPELIQVNVWVPSGYGTPSLYVVIDDGPNDPTVGPVDYEVMLIPSANNPNLYEPDPNCEVRLDPISTGGVADFYATLPSVGSKGAMEVLTDQIVVAEVTLTDGGGTASESGDWEVTIPAGALRSGADGLVARDVAVTPQSPSHQLHLKPIGGAVSVFMMSSYDYWFNAGYYATFVAHYDDADLPAGFDETQLSAAWWDDYGNSKTVEWNFGGLRILSHDPELNTLTFNADYFYGVDEKSSPYGGGTIFSLIANVLEPNQGTIQITDPVVLPTVDDLTWAMPDLMSYVTDAVSLIDGDEVQMWLDGVRIWDDWDAARGFSGRFDNDVSGELRVWWSDYYEGGWHCAAPLMGGEHEVTVTAMNEVENYWTATSTFTVEYPHEGSVTDIIFLGSGNARLIDGVWYTDEFPVIQANVHDPFARMYYENNCDYDDYYDDYAGIDEHNLQVEIDGIEYAATQYYTEETGTWGVMEYYQPEELVGGEHTYDIIFTRNQVSYTYTGTFMVETVDVSSIRNWWFQEPIVTVGDVIWTHPCPTIKANISDLFGTLTWSDIELRIDGKEYEHVDYECGSTGDAGIMTYEHPYDDLLTNGQHSFTLGVTMNGVEFITEPVTFMVDASLPSLSNFDGGYVGATPQITFTVSDVGVGVDTESIHLDLYQMVQTTQPPNDAEKKEFLYTAFPSMLTFTTSGNDVTVSYSPVINLQDGEELEITLYNGEYTTYGTDSDDTGDRQYADEYGISDLVGNILTPATRRYIVDASGPEAAEMEVMENGMVCYIFQDLGAGLTCDDIEITMDDEVFTDYECEELDRTRVSVCFDPGDIGAEFKIKVTDAAGNFTIERFVNETLNVALGEDAHCYPNPATDGKTTIVYTVSKKSGVEVSLRIYDFAGEPVKTLYRGQPKKVGENTVVWYLDDDNGKAVGRGAYLCRIVAKDDAKTSAKVVKIAVAQTY